MVFAEGRGGRLRAMLDAFPDPIVLLEPVRSTAGTIIDFVYVEANAVACEHNRKPYEILIGMRLLSLLPEQRDTEFFQRYIRVFETGVPLDVRDHVYDEHPGSPHAQHYDTHISRTDGAILVSWRDVTQRHWAEQALLRANELLRSSQASEAQAIESAQAFSSIATHFRMLAENASDVVIETDTDGVIQWVSPSIESALGFSADSLFGTYAINLVVPEDHARVAPHRAGVYQGIDVSVSARYATADGDIRWMAVTAHPLRNPHGTVTGAVLGLHDVTAERRMAHMLETNERTLRMALDSAPQGMAISDLEDRLTLVNPALVALLGVPMGELIGRPISSALRRPDPAPPTCAEHILATGEDRVLSHRHEVKSEQGVAWVSHSVALVRDANERPQFFVHQVADASDAAANEHDLLTRATHDVLTGLLNRDGLESHVADLAPVRDGAMAHVAMLFCDLDGLKAINDEYGHLAGDEVLRTCAERVRSGVRSGDVCARISGDEFLIVCQRMQSLEDARALAEKICAQVNQPVMFQGRAIPVSVSIGVAAAEPEDTYESLLARADGALYRAKRSGRNCSAF